MVFIFSEYKNFLDKSMNNSNMLIYANRERGREREREREERERGREREREREREMRDWRGRLR